MRLAIALAAASLVVASPGTASADRVRCCDGTYSPTCTYVHSGCCSRHGGVCVAVAPPPPEQHGTVTPTDVRVTTDDGAVDSASLGRALAAARASLQGCYDSALLLIRNVEGEVTVSLRLGPSGGAMDLAVAGSATADRVSYCATRALRSVAWPATSNGTVDVAAVFELAINAPTPAAVRPRSRRPGARPPRRPRD